MTHDDGGPPPGVARGTAHLRVFQPLAAFPDAVQARLIAGAAWAAVDRSEAGR